VTCSRSQQPQAATSSHTKGSANPAPLRMHQDKLRASRRLRDGCKLAPTSKPDRYRVAGLKAKRANRASQSTILKFPSSRREPQASSPPVHDDRCQGPRTRVTRATSSEVPRKFDPGKPIASHQVVCPFPFVALE